MSALRDGLLDGLHVAVAGEPPALVVQRLEQLGALLGGADPGALVLDAGKAFGAGGRVGLTGVLEEVWAPVQAVGEHLIGRGATGKIALIAPAADAGPLAGAARAALENLARTLSIEWARYAITTAAILPGPATAEGELAELVGYLLSAAGDYFSGCRFELR